MAGTALVAGLAAATTAAAATTPTPPRPGRRRPRLSPPPPPSAAAAVVVRAGAPPPPRSSGGGGPRRPGRTDGHDMASVAAVNAGRGRRRLVPRLAATPAATRVGDAGVTSEGAGGELGDVSAGEPAGGERTHPPPPPCPAPASAAGSLTAPPSPPLTYAQIHAVVVAAAAADDWHLALRAFTIMHTQLRFVRRPTIVAVAPLRRRSWTATSRRGG